MAGRRFLCRGDPCGRPWPYRDARRRAGQAAAPTGWGVAQWTRGPYRHPACGRRRATPPPEGEARAPTAPAGHSPGGGGKGVVRIRLRVRAWVRLQRRRAMLGATGDAGGRLTTAETEAGEAGRSTTPPSPGGRDTPDDTSPGGGGKSPYRPCGTLPRRGRQEPLPPLQGTLLEREARAAEEAPTVTRLARDAGRHLPRRGRQERCADSTERPLPSPGLRRAASPLGRETPGDMPKTRGGGGKGGRGGPHRHPAGVTRRVTPPPEGEARAPTAPAGHSPGGGGKGVVRICRGRCNRFARMRCI